MALLANVGKVLKKFSRPEVDIVMSRNQLTNVIGFYGVSENTGTTNLCFNVAQALHTPATPVCILCLDFKLPTIWRYVTDEIPDDKSLMNKIKNATLPVNEVTVSENINSIAVASLTSYESPAEYCEIDLHAITSIMQELSVKYSYVIVDCGSELNAANTLGAILDCNKIYTCVRPIESQMGKLLTMNEIFTGLGYEHKFYDVIQCQALANEYTDADLEEYRLNLIGNIPYDYELGQAADNFKTISPVGVKSKNVKIFHRLVQFIADDIKNYVDKTGNYTPATIKVDKNYNPAREIEDNEDEGDEIL